MKASWIITANILAICAVSVWLAWTARDKILPTVTLTVRQEAMFEDARPMDLAEVSHYEVFRVVLEKTIPAERYPNGFIRVKIHSGAQCFAMRSVHLTGTPSKFSGIVCEP